MPEFFTMCDGYGHYCLAGKYAFADAVVKVDDVIAWCRENGHARLLVDIRELTGFPPPNTIQRFEFATRWAESAAGRVAISFLAPPGLIDTDKIGITMANNRGLRSDVFTDEADAIAWLKH